MAAPGFGVVGMFSLGQDGTSDYDGFVFEGNGCLIDGQNFASTAGLFVTGRSREVFHFSLRNFRVQNCKDYGIGIGRQLSIMSGSWAGLVKVENFDLNNCGWIRVWSSEHVLLRNGRCRVIPDVLINGWFITSQHSGAGNMITRDVVLEDLVGETGSAQYDTTLEVQGNLGGTNADVTRDVLFRRCYLKGRASKDWFIDDTVNVLGPGAVESLTFEDCMFDSMASQTPAGMIVSNASEGYVSFDHCDFVNGAALPTTSYVMNSGGSPATRPLIVRRPQRDHRFHSPRRHGRRNGRSRRGVQPILRRCTSGLVYRHTSPLDDCGAATVSQRGLSLAPSSKASRRLPET